MGRFKLDSVNEFARRGYNLKIVCDGCSRVVEASSVLMQQELHRRRISLSIERLEERMKCKICGHRGAAIMACEIKF